MHARRNLATIVWATIVWSAGGSACAGQRAGESSLAAAESARREIRRQIARHADAWRENDADAAAALYADGAVLQFPDAPDVRGPAAIRTTFAQLFESLRIESLELTLDTVEVYGDVAYEWGHYREVYRPVGQAAVQEEGRYIMRWARQADGAWRITRFAGSSVRRSPV